MKKGLPEDSFTRCDLFVSDRDFLPAETKLSFFPEGGGGCSRFCSNFRGGAPDFALIFRGEGAPDFALIFRGGSSKFLVGGFLGGEFLQIFGGFLQIFWGGGGCIFWGGPGSSKFFGCLFWGGVLHRNTVNIWLVRILLECILVKHFFCAI